MLKILKTVLLSSFLGFQGQFTFADVGNGQVVQCNSADGMKSFEIHSTAIPKKFEGTYEDYSLECKEVNETRTNMNLLWKCIEKRSGEGRLIILVKKGGFTGFASADIFMEQIFPLDPAYLTTLSCN